MAHNRKLITWLSALAALIVVALVVGFIGISNGWFNGSPSSAASSTASSNSSASSSGMGTPSASSSAPSASTGVSPTISPTSTAKPTDPPALPQPGSPQAKLTSLSLEQKVGQIFMVSAEVTGADQASISALTDLHIGNVFLRGRGYGGTGAIGGVVNSVKGLVNTDTTGGVKQFVATDQEGGLVQIMNGPGFSAMPKAIDQGAVGPGQLKANATVWGQQLAATGVNVNFAPVLDTVPSPGFAPQNAPIGAFGRQYGYDQQTVSSLGVSAAQGFAAAGVAPTVKHFPGLGRVTGNTDTTVNVTDSQTTRNDPYLQPFKDAVSSGVNWVMVSNAYYPSIDQAAYAPFSSVVIRDMLRGDLSFQGIVITDDVCDAVQVSPVPVAERGVDFVKAGGTMVLCTNQGKVPAMYQGVLAAAKADPGFAKLVDQAALKVLEIKSKSGLL